MSEVRPIRSARRLAAGALVAAALIAAQAQAAGSGMPWEEPLQKVLESVDAATRADYLALTGQG